MDHTSSGSRIDVADLQWSLADTLPGQLALRFAGAALGVGLVGGVVTAWLAGLFSSNDLSPVALTVLVGLPVVLVVMIGWRLVASAGHADPRPSGRWLGRVAVAGTALAVVVGAWPETRELDGGVAEVVGGVLLVALFGALYGMMPAVVSIVVLVPALLLLRARKVRVPLVAAEVLLTVFAMAVTAVFAVWVTSSLGGEVVSGLAAALAGTGAVLTARWCLVDRRV